MNPPEDPPAPADPPPRQRTPTDPRMSGVGVIWGPEEISRAFDYIVKNNPRHLALFSEMVKVLLRSPISRVVDIGGGTGAFAQFMRKSSIATPCVVVDREAGMLALAVEKNIPDVQTVCAEFGDHQITRATDEERITVTASYVLHNFTPDVRNWFFSWLRTNLRTGEVCIIGDTVADHPPDDPIRQIVNRQREAFRFFHAVGAEFWMNDEAIPLSHRLAILDHTAHDRHTAPDFHEYQNLAAQHGFAMQRHWEDGFLRVISFTKQ